MAIELVTSENREEYMEKKLAEKAGKKFKKKAETREQMLIRKLGKKGAMQALEHEKNMGDSETSLPK